MVLVLDSEVVVENKVVFNSDKEISYPFFGSEKVDNYINNYLNEYIEMDDEVLIDYDYRDKDKLYYVTFYKYIFNNNMIKSDTDTFIVDIKNNTINRCEMVNYEYDVLQNSIVDTDNKMIALTFDDGPNYNTNRVLDILLEYDISATFFVLGSKIKENEDILKRIIDSGSEIGNHTYNHLILTKYDDDKIKDEIESTSELIFDVTGKYPKLLRPSYGIVNNKVKKIANYPIIIWDVDTLDWKYHNSNKIANRVLNKASDGDIVLMHDVYSSTSNALRIIIPELKKRGYSFVTVSELFYYKKIELEKGKVYGFA